VILPSDIDEDHNRGTGFRNDGRSHGGSIGRKGNEFRSENGISFRIGAVCANQLATGNLA